MEKKTASTESKIDDELFNESHKVVRPDFPLMPSQRLNDLTTRERASESAAPHMASHMPQGQLDPIGRSKNTLGRRGW